MHLRFLKRLSGKTPREQSSSGKKIGAESAVLHFVFFIVIVNKMQQSAKEGCLLKRNTVLEVFPLTAILAGSGKTMPFEKRHAGCEEREKINRRRIYDTLRINFFEATKQTACIFSKGDKNNPQGLRVHKHIFVGNSRLVTAMTHTDNNGDNAEQREKRYYYHSDHLGSAQFVTDWRGRQYEHIEYTPYGELWIEEVAAGLDKLPFRFTGKEMDEETGLYYYGARYLDPKYSRWLSGDPALGDYIPKAPTDDEAKKHNENLPGMGGVYNIVNLHLYHYAGNNPVKYEDPDGAFILMVGLSNTAGGGLGVSNNSGFFVSLPLNGKDASIGTYTISQTGAYIGLGASSGIELTLAPFADEFSDIEGFSLVSGASVSISGLIGVGGEIGYNPTANSLSEKIQSITIAGSITANVPGGSPGEVHTWTAYTVKVSELNISKTCREIKQITNDIEKFLKNKDTDGLMNYLKENELIFQGM